MSACVCFKHCCLHAFFSNHILLYSVVVSLICMYVNMLISVCGRHRITAGDSPWELFTLSCEIASPTRLQFRRSWLASKSQKSSCLCISSARTISGLSFSLPVNPIFSLCSRGPNSGFHSCMASIY